jgi:hypothetical protein
MMIHSDPFQPQLVSQNSRNTFPMKAASFDDPFQDTPNQWNNQMMNVNTNNTNDPWRIPNVNYSNQPIMPLPTNDPFATNADTSNSIKPLQQIKKADGLFADLISVAQQPSSRQPRTTSLENKRLQ